MNNPHVCGMFMVNRFFCIFFYFKLHVPDGLENSRKTF